MPVAPTLDTDTDRGVSARPLVGRSRRLLLAAILMLAAGCDGPEAVRTRGERGADVGNYPGLPLPVPSKLDNTKNLDRFRGDTHERP